MRHWFYIVERDTEPSQHWLFVLSLNVAINFALWALFIWMASAIVNRVLIS